MSDSEITNATSALEQDSQPLGNKAQYATKLNKPGGISFSICPPTQRTHDVIVNPLIETRATPFVLSKHCSIMHHNKASFVARQIKEEAFAVAGGFASVEDNDIKILQAYSKEIRKQMLNTVKARSTSASTVNRYTSHIASSEVPPSRQQKQPPWK